VPPQAARGAQWRDQQPALTFGVSLTALAPRRQPEAEDVPLRVAA